MWAWPGAMSRTPSSRSRARWRSDSCRARSSGLSSTRRIVSVRGGRSSSTCDLVRRRMKGWTRDLRMWLACWSWSISMGRTKRSWKRSSEPSRPGLMKRNRFQSSASRFSMGVPVEIMRKPPIRLIAAEDRFVAAFLIAWASSRTIVANCTSLRTSASCWSSVYEQMTRSNGPRALRTRSRRPRSPMPKRTGRSVGANRWASETQLAQTLVGAATSVGPWEARCRITARASTVLPSPMSSARQAPTPHSASRASQVKPSAWYGRSVAWRVEGMRGLIGLDRAQPLEVGVEYRIRPELADLVLPLLQADGRQRVHAQGVALADELGRRRRAIAVACAVAGSGRCTGPCRGR